MFNFRKNNAEIQQLVYHFSEVCEHEPWHGKGIKAILNDVNPELVFEKPGGQHSILELVWHMMNRKRICVEPLAAQQQRLRPF